MEELKLINEIMKGLSGDATTAFIIWAVAKYFVVNALLFGFLTFLVMKIYQVFIEMIHACSHTTYLESLRDQLNIGGHGCLESAEFKQIKKKLKEILDAKD